jgi:ABC-type multidrug transport system fused ATPase/permease subunit
MAKKSGTFYLNGSLAYCAQQPWILTDTILGNIVFNEDIDQQKLQSVIKACALDTDLELFPNGLLTEIGEKGVNLSGGQKARIALARALYKLPDIYFLDDPISALDSHVGRHVFDHAIKEYLAEKTVVLVTHQLHLLPEMDQIFVLQNGTLAEHGTYKELMATGKILPELMVNYNIDENNSDQKKVVQNAEVEDSSNVERGNIIVAEEREKGSVDFSVFWDYFEKCGGWAYVITFSFAAILNSTTQVLNNVWLTWWTQNKNGYSQGTYQLVYGVLGIAQFLFALTINTVFLFGAYRASKRYHKLALSQLLYAPMSFFDSQPIGKY